MTSGELPSVTEMSDYRDRRVLPAGNDRAWAVPDTLPTPPPTGTVTFLLTDIEGSTRRWESHNDAMAAAVARHYEILDLAMLASGGVRPIEQGEGDSMVAAFARASDAAAAALAAQTALHAEAWPDGADVSVRMALHTGEAQLRDGLYYVGPSIIRCARLRALAHGGQVLVSTTTADLLAAGLPAEATLVPLGVHRLKDLREAERVYQLAHPALPAQFPPLRSLETLPHNLPAQLSSFVGRAAELAELADLMARHRLVSLVGSGGCGKTRLAVEAAEAARPSYPDGAWWVDLATVADPARVPDAVLAAIGLDGKAMEATERVTGYLADRRVLLVLDNCEHVLAAVADLVERVLRACPGVAALATSREPLGVGGEAAWQVDPLLDSEAVRLFAERAGEARSGFRLDAANAPAVAAICARLDGIPLAIELAAARIRSLSPERLLQSLDDRFRILTGGPRTAAPRQQTLAASVEWSHDLLAESERALLRRLSVFTGAFDADAAEAVCAGGEAGAAELAGWEVLTLLGDLVARSLVGFDGERYRLLQTIREFAAARLEDAAEGPVVRRRHLRHYADVASAGARDLEVGPRIPMLDALEAARENILAAVDFALADADHEAALALCGDMALFWQIRGRHSESLDRVRRVLAATPAEASAQRARTLCAAGQLGFFTMDLTGGYGTVETAAAIEMAKAVGSDEVLGRALGIQNLLMSFGTASAGQDGLAEAYAVAERAGDPYGMTAATIYTAFAWVFGCDRPDLARPHLARIATGGGSPVWSIYHGLLTGITAWRTGRLSRAVEAFTTADDLAWAVGDPVLESWCATWLAETLVCLGEFVAAEEVCSRSGAWMDRSSFARLELVLSRRISSAMAQGDLPGARRALDAVEAVGRSAGFPCFTLEFAVFGGRLALEDGDLDVARAAAEEAAAIGEVLGTPWYQALAADLTARVARADGRPGPAEDAHHRALALCVEYGFRGAAATTLEALASLACAAEGHAEAARLLGAAEVLRQDSGQVRWEIDQSAYDSDLAALRAALGEDGLAAAWAEGRGLYLAEAAAYAVRARAERKRPSRGWTALTTTELEVVALAIQGLTNAQIAARLFIAPGTAKVHLSHIYGKLEIAGRTQLAVLATAHGVSAPEG